MKILMLTPYFPYPPYSGGQTRSFNLIKSLGKKHEITLFSFIREDKEEKFKKYLSPYCRQIKLFKRRKAWEPINILLAGLSFYPFLVCIYLSGKIKKIITQELQRTNYDIIHVETFYLMPNIPKTEVPILLVDQTIEYQVYQHFVRSLSKFLFFLKPLLWLDVAKLKFWETFYWKKARMMVAVSEEDRVLMKKLVKNLAVEIVPNGVDYQHFGQKIYPKAKNPTLLFGLANFKWMQNKEGAKILINQVWPLIRKFTTEARLWIIGRHAPEFLSEMGSVDILIQEADDPRKFYQQAWILVAPMKSGGGSRTKFFEAMAAGLPIVTTPEGAEGIEAKNNREIFIINDVKKLADQAISLIKNRELADKVGRQAQKLVKEKYSWYGSALKLEKIYRALINEN